MDDLLAVLFATARLGVRDVFMRSVFVRQRFRRRIAALARFRVVNRPNTARRE